jgi:hypothetical protein
MPISSCECGIGGEAACRFSGTRECAPGPQGRPNRPSSTIPPVVGRRGRPIDGHSIDQTDSYWRSGAGTPTARRSNQTNDYRLPPRGRRCQRCPLTCGFEARGGIRTHDLSITSQMLRVRLDGAGRKLPAHVGWPVDLVGSRRIQKDRLDDHRDDQCPFDSRSNGPGG